MFGYVAFYDPSRAGFDNRVFDLMVERTYGAMTNDTLLSIPLFVLMGYVMERGALVDKMFYSVQLAFRRVPASLAVATLIVCTFWGIASGLVGAVVVLMGVIAMRPMLKAGYDVRLASGVITAGGTLGILIPPSVMIIVYAAVAGQSVVKLYASAMLPGFFLAFLYLVYVIGWALIDPKVAPTLPESELHAPIPGWVTGLAQRTRATCSRRSRWRSCCPAGRSASSRTARRSATARWLKNLFVALAPLLLTVATLAGIWWYVTIHRPASLAEASAAAADRTAGAAHRPYLRRPTDEAPKELAAAGPTARGDAAPEQEQGAGRAGSKPMRGAAAPTPVRRRSSTPGSGCPARSALRCSPSTTGRSVPSSS